MVSDFDIYAKKIDKDLHKVDGDIDRLVQVVTNLLSNAVKFTPENGKITIEAGVYNKEYLVSWRE